MMRCTFDDCKEPIYGYRVRRDGYKVLLCEKHFHILDNVYIDNKMIILSNNANVLNNDTKEEEWKQ
jgi:hypothetical protein